MSRVMRKKPKMVLDVDSIESLKRAVLNALASVYENDYFLIEKCCHELTVVAAFFRAFCEQNQIANEQIKVDMEYSRMGESLEAKPAPPNEHGKKHMRIDFVIHQRGNQHNNKLAIEFKSGNSKKDIDWDYEKLKSVTSHVVDPHQVRNYGLGLSLQYDEQSVVLVAFVDGVEQSEERYLWNSKKKGFTPHDVKEIEHRDIVSFKKVSD